MSTAGDKTSSRLLLQVPTLQQSKPGSRCSYRNLLFSCAALGLVVLSWETVALLVTGLRGVPFRPPRSRPC